TDRPVYKPGDTVRFTVYARTPSYEKSLPAGTAGKERKYPIFVTDARGKEIFRKEFHPDRNSSFSCAFELSQEASLGTYRIFAQGGTIAFRVEEYKKPEYELSIQTGKGVVKSGEEIEFLLQGKYFSGAPMAGAKISYRIFRREKMFFFPHPMPFDFLYGKGYFFCCRRWMPPFFVSQWGNSGEELVKEGELLCDDRGKCTVKVEKRFTERFAGKDSLYTIRAEVFDDSRAVVSASKSVTVSSVPFHVILRTSRGFYSPGEVVVPRVSAFTPDGKKVEDGFVILSLYERTFGASLVPEKGKLLKQEKYPLGEEKKFAFSAGKSASFLLEAEVVTKEGKSSASVPVLVRGMEEEKKTDPLFTELPFEVIRDKSTYAPGDTAKLLLLSRRENIPVYLFFRPCREDGMEKVHLRGKSLVVEMKITEKDYPNTFFEALCVQDGKVCKERVELPVPPRKKSLVLSLLPAGKECGPGEKLPLKIFLKDADGKGVEGVFTLAVYDRALEEISPNNVRSIFPFFWSWKRYFSGMLYSFADLRTPVHKGADIPGLPGVYTLWFLPEKSASGFGMEKKAFPRSSFRGRADFSKGMNGVMAMRKKAPRMEEKASADMALPGGAQGPEQTLPVRKDFADSILWIGCRETGKDGSAEVTIPVPDNLTSWRIRAWGLTRDNHVGEGVSEFAVNRKLMARLTLPEFLVRGDASSAVAHFHNLTDKPMQITCSLECASPAVILRDVPAGRKELFLSLPPGGYASVNIPCLAMREGEGKFLLKARDAGSGHADALLLSLPVFVKGAPKTVHHAGALEKGNISRTKITEYTIPAERKENASFLTVRLSPSVAASAMRLLPFLAAENSKNSFGIISRFVPAFAAKKALDELKTDFDSLSLSPGKLDPLWREYIQKNDVPVYTNALFRKNLAEGERMLRLMRTSDGGWGWFSSHYERSFPDTTAEVVDALLLVKGKESVSQDAVLREGLLWLKRHAESRLALLEKEKSAPEETDALVLKVLAAGGIVLPALEKKLFEMRKHFSPCALAMLGLSLPKNSPMRKEVLRNLTNYLVRNEEAGTAYLQVPESFFRFWTGDENTANASYLLLLLDEDPGNPLCGAI
ncbi:MAG: hypothetical protein J6331_08435, partial [Lentisphaeria bacterium]|nr:hypothetical protein [Lentisphaeria bacterium]